jgi:ribosomal protein S27AE
MSDWNVYMHKVKPESICEVGRQMNNTCEVIDAIHQLMDMKIPKDANVCPTCGDSFLVDAGDWNVCMKCFRKWKESLLPDTKDSQ